MTKISFETVAYVLAGLLSMAFLLGWWLGKRRAAKSLDQRCDGVDLLPGSGPYRDPAEPGARADGPPTKEEAPAAKPGPLSMSAWELGEVAEDFRKLAVVSGLNRADFLLVLSTLQKQLDPTPSESDDRTPEPSEK